MKERAPFYGYDEAEQATLYAGLEAASRLVDATQGILEYLGVETARYVGFNQDRYQINKALAMVARKRSQ